MGLLGGQALFLGPQDIQLGVNESLKVGRWIYMVALGLPSPVLSLLMTLYVYIMYAVIIAGYRFGPESFQFHFIGPCL